MDKNKKVKAIGNIIGFNIDASGNETYNVQFPDMTIAELESYQFEEADAYRANEKPLYLRNVLARLRELPEHDRKVWMDEIMHEFANDYGSVKYTLGYEQGKLDGAVEAEKSNKVVIPRFVAKYIEECKKQRRSLKDSMDKRSAPFKVSIWLMRSGEYYNYKNQELFVRAWLDGYDVEQEKRYTVMLCNGQSLKKVYRQGDDYLDFKIGYSNFDSFTKQQLEDAGFGWVFDCEGVEVQEVQEVE